MNRSVPWLLPLSTVICICLSPSEQSVTAGQQKPTARDWQNTVLVTETRPILLRLHIHTNGRPFHFAWNQYIDVLFDYLDVDGNDLLDSREQMCAPSAPQLLQQLLGEEIEPSPPPIFVGAKNGVTLERFRNHYQQNGIGPVFLEFGSRRNGPDLPSEKLLALLDKNRDGKLAKAELQQMNTVLQQLDRDDNEAVTVAEILGSAASAPFSFSPSYRFPKNARLFLLTGARANASDRTVQIVLKKYDRNNDGKLTQKEIGWPAGIFTRYDKNHDRRWSPHELAKRFGGPADLEVVVRLEKSHLLPAKPAKEKLEIRKNRSKLDIRRGRRRSLLFELGKEQFKLLFGAADRADVATAGRRYLFRFQSSDNGDGVLDKKEIYRPPFEWAAILRLADRNSDDRLSRKELAAYAKLLERGAASFTRLTIADRSPSLFETIDADHDGQLGLRDLRSGWNQFRRWDKNGDGAIDLTELPRQVHLVVSIGRPFTDVRNLAAPGYGTAKRPALTNEGPLWFRLMDRNSDGDVSPREFLAPKKIFDRIDRDNDGLIDSYEAENAPPPGKTGRKDTCQLSPGDSHEADDRCIDSVLIREAHCPTDRSATQSGRRQTSGALQEIP